MTHRYEKQILEAFDRLGFKPRDRQVEYVNRILEAFLDEKVTNVVLSAPTGTGKSIIGAVTAEALHSIKYPDSSVGASFMLTATNVLAQQYADTFGKVEEKDPDSFLIVKGAANYVCEALTNADEPAFADSCTIQVFRKTGMQDMIERYCNQCEYAISRKRRSTCRHLITNYSYFFIDRMYATHPMEKRTVSIFDEAHLLNDLFVDHNAIYFSERRLTTFADEIQEQLNMGYHQVFKDIKQLRLDLERGAINEGNYKQKLQKLREIYQTVSGVAHQRAEQAVRQPSKYLKLSRLSKKYADLSCKIDDLFLFDYPHVLEVKLKDHRKGQNEAEFTVKPIFVGEMFAVLHNADHNLLMSATISESYAKRTMSLPGTTKHIRLDPHFPKENKKVVFFKPLTLNYSTLQDTAVVKRLCATVYEIVAHHSALNERGIVLAPSFKVAESIAGTLRGMAVPNLRLFEHAKGQKLAEVLENFKGYEDGPALLITPSGFEGIDLPGDLSRYQVIVKAPFASLGDKRIEFILNTYPDIYSLTALMKIVQGAGRSVRSMEDHAVTYMLDTAIQRLWSKNNEWLSEFQTSYTSNLLSEDAA